MSAEKGLIEILTKNGQTHLAAHLPLMTADEKALLLQDLEQADFKLLNRLFETSRKPAASATGSRVFDAAEVLSFTDETASLAEKKRLYALGEDFLRRGKVAVFLVAGGQGTRLGFDGPKGCYPVSPVKGKSLFQLFAENIACLQRKYANDLKWYIMTSSENNSRTRSFFRENAFFGLSEKNIRFFIQKEIPSFDLNGKLILSGNKRLLKNPNGHGGSIQALDDSGALDEMRQSGVEEIFYFQVDNPLAVIADPLFVGAHVSRGADISSKVVQKADPDERVGIIGKIDGRPGCIEYSELSQAQIHERNADGSLKFSSGNIAIHMLKRSFVEKLNAGKNKGLPYHLAVKEIAALVVECGKPVLKKIQGMKPEMFIFDALAFAEKTVTLAVSRADEFAPVKNRAGKDSPETAAQAMSEKYRRWLQAAGQVRLPDPNAAVEISPLFACDQEEFCRKFTPRSDLSSPFYLA